jgi:drug/metabolite transporter (DMT)-like permease
MSRLTNHVLLFIVAAIYAATFSIAKDVMPEFLGAYGFIVLRIVTATTLFWIVHTLFVREKVKHKKDYLLFAVAGFFGMAANMLMFFKGLETAYPIHGSVLMLAAPVFVLIFQKIIHKTLIRNVQWLGIVVALTGAFFLLAGKNLKFTEDTLWGDLLILLNAISYSFYLVFVKKLLLRYHFITVAKWSFTAALILVIPVGMSDLLEADFKSFPTYIWWEIAFVLVLTTFVTYLLNAFVIQRATPALVGSYIYLQPLLATAIAVAWGVDEVTVEKVAFSILIFTGVYLINKKKKK